MIQPFRKETKNGLPHLQLGDYEVMDHPSRLMNSLSSDQLYFMEHLAGAGKYADIICTDTELRDLIDKGLIEVDPQDSTPPFKLTVLAKTIGRIE